MTTSKLKQFAYEDKFRMSFDNVLIFAGHFIDFSAKNNLGKTLYIPLTERHPAFTFRITGQSFSNEGETVGLSIRFASEEEREAVACCNFLNDIFFIE